MVTQHAPGMQEHQEDGTGLCSGCRVGGMRTEQTHLLPKPHDMLSPWPTWLCHAVDGTVVVYSNIHTIHGDSSANSSSTNQFPAENCKKKGKKNTEPLKAYRCPALSSGTQSVSQPKAEQAGRVAPILPPWCTCKHLINTPCSHGLECQLSVTGVKL